jgi:hypothetical protein
VRAAGAAPLLRCSCASTPAAAAAAAAGCAGLRGARRLRGAGGRAGSASEGVFDGRTDSASARATAKEVQGGRARRQASCRGGVRYTAALACVVTGRGRAFSQGMAWPPQCAGRCGCASAERSRSPCALSTTLSVGLLATLSFRLSATLSFCLSATLSLGLSATLSLGLSATLSLGLSQLLAERPTLYQDHLRQTFGDKVRAPIPPPSIPPCSLPGPTSAPRLGPPRPRPHLDWVPRPPSAHICTRTDPTRTCSPP